MKIGYKRIYLAVMSLIMAGLCCFGAYGLVSAPAKAKAAQDEIERQLREAQEEADRKKQEALEEADRKKLEALAGKTRSEIVAEDVTVDMLRKRYDSAE